MHWLLLTIVGVGGSATDNYVGATRCATCHEEIYKAWSSGPHARAHESLSEKQLTDVKCNTCHTTVPGESNTNMPGIQCERCHGPGRYYQSAFVMRDRKLARAVGLIDPTSEHCVQCHTEGVPSIEPFSFDTMWARIGHARSTGADSEGGAQ